MSTDAVRIVCGAGSVKRPCVRPSVCLSHHLTTAEVGLLLSTVQAGDIDWQKRPGVPSSSSGKCEQCHVDSWRRKLNTDLIRIGLFSGVSFWTAWAISEVFLNLSRLAWVVSVRTSCNLCPPLAVCFLANAYNQWHNYKFWAPRQTFATGPSPPLNL